MSLKDKVAAWVAAGGTHKRGHRGARFFNRHGLEIAADTFAVLHVDSADWTAYLNRGNPAETRIMPDGHPAVPEVDESKGEKVIENIVDFEQMHPAEAMKIVRKVRTAAKRVVPEFEDLLNHVDGALEVPLTLCLIDRVAQRLHDIRRVLAVPMLVTVCVLTLAGCGSSHAPESAAPVSQCPNGHCRVQ